MDIEKLNKINEIIDAINKCRIEIVEQQTYNPNVDFNDDDDLTLLMEQLFELLHGDIDYGGCIVFEKYNSIKKGRNENEYQKKLEDAKRCLCGELFEYAYRYPKYRLHDTVSFPAYLILRFKEKKHSYRAGTSIDFDRVANNDPNEETEVIDVDDNVLDGQDDTNDWFNEELEIASVEYEEELKPSFIEDEDYDVIHFGTEPDENESRPQIRRQKQLKEVHDAFILDEYYDLALWRRKFGDDYGKIREAYEKKYQITISDSDLRRSITTALIIENSLTEQHKNK